MVNFISAQANVASEDLSANLPASVASTATFFVMTVLAVWLHWGVVGIASAMLGTIASFHIDGATGACIVLIQTAFFLAAFLFAPKRGILTRVWAKSEATSG